MRVAREKVASLNLVFRSRKHDEQAPSYGGACFFCDEPGRDEATNPTTVVTPAARCPAPPAGQALNP
jgi:hypothetical protein